MPGSILLLLAASYIPIWQGKEPVKVCIDASVEHLRPEILYAFWTWIGNTGLGWEETRDCAGQRTVAYRMGAVPEPLYAVGFYPPVFIPEVPDQNGWRIGGDVILSSSFPWEPRSGMTLAVLLHETGHAMGLPHSSSPNDVMHPSVLAGRISLSLADRSFVRFLYLGEPPVALPKLVM